VKHLLLVTHRPIEQEGGPAARWRAFARYLPEHGWSVEVLSATERAGASEFDAGAQRAVAVRAAVMARVGRASAPLFALAGVRPDALPLSMLWVPLGARRLRRRLAGGGIDVAGPLAARVGTGRDHSDSGVPLLVELRDLWAGSPAFDAGGRLLSAVESWMLGAARRVVVCTPAAASDLARRHPDVSGRVVEVPNGFDPRVRAIAAQRTRRERRQPLSLLHSGTLTPARPIGPLIDALGDTRVAGAFRLVLHGYLSPASRAEVERAESEGKVQIDVLAPSSWEQAVERIADADACLITQAREAGDETAVASKVYEYLALGKPVLCLSDGGATEALLRRLGANRCCARLNSPEMIVDALVALRDEPPRELPSELLDPYDRRVLAGRMAALLDEASSGR
jgi:glycosyltransferase involved in cell wall biosynthesis